MRRRLWYGSWMTGLVLVTAVLLQARLAPLAAREDMPVDVELILAVDISYSMDSDEQALQRDGYVEALTSPEFLQALRLGPHGRIAVAYVEWAGEHEQQIVVNWRLIDGPETAKAFAETLRAAPMHRVYRTSISSALLFGADLFDLNGYEGLRRVIDVSGDGVNNQGPPVALARDSVLQRGIVINGLPLVTKRSAAAMDVPELDVYYEDCVIGGPGAFVIPVEQMAGFARAIKTKLVMEVAGMMPATPQLPTTPKGLSPYPAVPASAKAPRISCTIGEKQWLDNWNN